VADATAKMDPELKLWERFRMTPLGPEELLSALVAATKLDAVVRATGRLDLEEVRFRVKQRYGFLFDVDEDNDESEYDGTIAQALALLNGGVVAAGSSALPASALSDVLATPGGDAEKIESLYVRVLGRYPSADESATWTKFLADAPKSAPLPPAPKQHKPGDKPRGPDPLRPLETRAARERADSHARAYEDLLWVLLNSSEFVLNH
jgi:hypothetical protein